MSDREHSVSKREIARKNNSNIKYISRLSVVFALISIPVGWLVARATDAGGWGDQTFMLWWFVISLAIFGVGLVLGLSTKFESLKLWHVGVFLNSVGLVALTVLGFSTYMASTGGLQNSTASIEGTEVAAVSDRTDLTKVSGNSDLGGAAGDPDIANVTDIANVANSADITDYTNDTDKANVANSADITNYADDTDITNVPNTADIADYTDNEDVTTVTGDTDVTAVTDDSDIANVTDNKERVSTTGEEFVNELTDPVVQGENNLNTRDDGFQYADYSASDSFQSSYSRVVNVRDWGSGFQVQHKCVLPSNIYRMTRFEIAIDYRGPGYVKTTWMHGYNGPIDSGYVLSDGGKGIASSHRYVPPMTGNDILLFTTQVDGAGYASADLHLDCRIQGRI